MYREIIKDLIRWKNNNRRKPLILTGVRQCGKTYIAEEFGRDNFSNLVVINFEQDRSVSALFDYDFDVKRIVAEISRLKKQISFQGRRFYFLMKYRNVGRQLLLLNISVRICAGST